MMRITAYSDRLLDDLDLLDWPDQIKSMQRNWIGRSTGVNALFSATTGRADSATEVEIKVFTTGPTPCSAPRIWYSRPSMTWSTISSPKRGPTRPTPAGHSAPPHRVRPSPPTVAR